ncbi:MAG: AI-2E family transporter [Lachnospiraceae bacterium]|nr:AI-2E family transporter [Lachnospiraceae bacterium]
MNLGRKDMKKVRGLILFTAAVILALLKFDWLWGMLVFLINILKPFILGAVIAFVLNLPMSFFEKKLFGRRGISEKKRIYYEKVKRPLSLILSFLTVTLVVTAVMVIVISQLTSTIGVLTREIPDFMKKILAFIESILVTNPEYQQIIGTLEIPEIDWQETIKSIVNFLKNGMGNLAATTFSVASSIASGTVNFFIALIFSFYILVQKEKLGDQIQRVLRAYTKPKLYQWIMKVAGLLNQNFSRFITGQCLEAVILGTMFIVSMTILRFPFAVMIGVLIAFTALIPVVGAFIGCAVGTFLILVDSPAKAIGFIVLFLILQQIEGNLIYPHVVGNSVGLPSIWVLAAVTIGGSLMGISGMLIFIPLLSTVYALLREDVNKRNALSAGKKETKQE